jgi:hypothetical protein
MLDTQQTFKVEKKAINRDVITIRIRDIIYVYIPLLEQMVDGKILI